MVKANIVLRDGYVFETDVIHHCRDFCVSRNADSYLLIPWTDIKRSYVTFDEHNEANRIARLRKLGPKDI
jgi:hypothetical protein